MRSTPQSEFSGGPRTCVGRWLCAGLRGESKDYNRLAHTLNRGQKGWNDDEPAVVEAACEMAVRRFFAAILNPAIADVLERIA
jgi:hypothetical protein